MALDTNGIVSFVTLAGEQVNVLMPKLREVFVNETPLVSRLARLPATSKVYSFTNYNPRVRAATLGTGGVTTNVQTSIPFADASQYQVGDVLELNDGTNMERVEVVSAPVLTTTPNTVTVRRGREGTTAVATFAAGINVYLIGNSRVGTEGDQVAIRSVRTATQQIVQTFQFPVQVGGEAQAISNVPMPPGYASVFDLEKATKLIELMRDQEYTSYYGLGELPAAEGDRGKQKGLRTLIGTYNGGANVDTTTKTNYTKAQFLAGTIQKIYDAGGDPDLILCSTDFMGFLMTWAPTQTAVLGGNYTKALNQPIDEFILPLTGKPMMFVPSLQLRKGTAAVLSSKDLNLRVLRDEYYQPRGYRGDATEGDWLSSMCIDMGHPAWHAWSENIQSVA
jgi:hypothetical protein